MSLPPSNIIAQLPLETKTAALGLLFEPCEQLVDLALPILAKARNDSTWPQIINEIRTELTKLPYNDQRVTGIVAAHPRLGAKKVDSAQSQAEQASLKSSKSEAVEFQKWNDNYEVAFPGLRYVVFVNGRPRSEILLNMKRRIEENNFKNEVVRAFNAMCDIALDRQQKLALNTEK